MSAMGGKHTPGVVRLRLDGLLSLLLRLKLFHTRGLPNRAEAA
jgi:hypothetical protein